MKSCEKRLSLIVVVNELYALYFFGNNGGPLGRQWRTGSRAALCREEESEGAGLGKHNPLPFREINPSH
ncbi:nitrate reductase [Sesbania bispinosa]|nr:nitrate reductase [Sesbania bispinosa]